MILWLRRILVILLELLGAAVAAAFVLAALLAWRLSEGPLRLESLEPYLLTGLSQLAQPYKISLSQTALTWGKDRTSLGLQASDVRIITPEGMLMATVPEVEIDLSVPALLLGRPAPKAVRLTGPQLRLLRSAAGDIQLSLAGNGAAAAGGDGDLLQRWLVALSEDPEPASLLGALREVEISSAKMAVDDHQYNVRWLAPRLDLALARDQDGIRGTINLEVATGSKTANLSGRLVYDRRQAALRTRLTLDQFNPAELAQSSADFASLARINLPLRGSLALRWARPLGISELEFDLAAGAGQVAVQADQPALAVEYAKLAGRIDRVQRTAEVSELYVDFGGPMLEGAVSAHREGNQVLVAAQGQVSRLPAAQLSRYWPPEIARGARKWVIGNITDGEVPTAQARVRLQVPLDNPAAVKVESVDGNMILKDLTVHYFRPLPPATEAGGYAHFDRDSFNITVESGHVGGISIPAATVRLQGLADNSDRADIELLAVGSVADQLQLLDHDPLRYARRLGIAAARARGEARTSARFMFPLIRDLPIEQVAISAASTLRDVGLPALVAGQDLRNGQLSLSLDGGGMKIVGTGQLGPAPATFSWTESFLSDVSPSSEIEFSGSMDEAARQAFRVSWPEVVGGEVGVTGHYRKDRGQPAQLDLELDFAKAALALPWFSWYKPAGEPGRGTASVRIDHQQVAGVPAFTLEAAGARGRGRVEFAGESRWSRVVLDRINVPGSDLSGEISNRRAEGLLMRLKGAAVDLRGIFEEARTATPPPAPAPAAATPPAALLPLDINFDFRRAVTGDDRSLSDARGRIVRNGRGWTRLEIDGRLVGGSTARIRLVPGGAGRVVDIQTGNAGGLFSTLRLMDNIRGGNLTVTGQGQGEGPVAAVADLRDFRYLNASTLRSIAAAAEPKGAEALAQQEGLAFSRLKARFDYAEDHLQVREARMAGDLLGLTLSGRVDLLASQLDLSGTIVPLYGINSAVGGIPIIGWLLTGGEGGGVFAATYTVRGPLKDPQTSVNPLAMLAPGFLRELFFVDSR